MDTASDAARANGMPAPPRAPLEAAAHARQIARLARIERAIVRLRWLGMAHWTLIVWRGAPPGAEGWAAAVVAVSIVYTAVTHYLIRRTRWVRSTVLATTLGDSTVATLMCFATGGIGSDVYPYFYMTVLAASLRFGVTETFLLVLLNGSCSLVLYELAPSPQVGPWELGVRLFFLFFTALMGSMLSREAREHDRRALYEGDRAGLLLAVNREITSTLDVAELLGRVLAQAARVIPCRGAAVLLLDRERATLDRVLVTGDFVRPTAGEVEASLRSGLLAEVRETGSVVLNDPAAIRSRVVSEPVRQLVRESLAILVLRRRDDLGFLVMADKRGAEKFTDDDVGLLSAVADQAAVAIENARLVEDVLEARDRGQRLLWRLIRAEEEERKRISGEIHDRMGARFFELYYSLRRCQESIGERDPAAAAALARVAGEAEAFSDEIRALMNELRPSVLDDFGFIEALREYVAALQAQGAFAVTLKVDDGVKPVRPEVNVMLFRVLQEAVLNVKKHAEAKHLAVEFTATKPGELCLAIRDDGRGFDPEQLPRGHYGLLHMKERAEACGGRFTVASQPARGTEVRVVVPEGAAA